MEAVPRLPMIYFKLKKSPDPTSFDSLKQYIVKYYEEDPDSYSKECYELAKLRGEAIRPTQDVEGCFKMKRYFCQLHSIQNRFQLNHLPESQQMLTFHWKDLYAGSVHSKSNIKYEMAVILHNIGSLHTQLGVAEGRSDPESMKKACTHFQCAAWAYGQVKDEYALVLQGDLSTELLIFMQHLCYAQAQECIMEKSLCDNRKSGIIAKVTAQIISYYNSALAALLTQNGDDGKIQDLVGNKLFKEWRKYVKFKISYLGCILFLYQGQQSEEQQKMGERVTLFQASFDKLEEARKESKGMNKIEAVNEALIFTMDVVEAKRKSAKNENEFIYHEDVPELASISAIQGANLVNGISFSVTDPDVCGKDIFHLLVPLKAHECSSMYSEEKATLLRCIGTKIEDKDVELNTFMSSLNMDTINMNNQNAINEPKLPQGLVDRCAAINAKPNAIPDLVHSMSNLADTCSEVETMLKEIKNLLKQDEIQEDSYQQKIGQRSNGGGHIVELNREFVKYQEAHNKAGESNETLRKAMGLHVSNLKVLALPLLEIQAQVPKCSEVIDEGTMKELHNIINKVKEMQQQRSQLHQELRKNINKDDITSQLIAIEAGENQSKMEELFKKELAKHEKIINLIEQNLKAQANILKALTEIYARCAPMIKTISDTKTKKDQFFSSLQGSYDVYEDLLSKSAKGLEFYKKLQGNVQKLLSRVKAACDVQDEERIQKLKSSQMAVTKRNEIVETKSSGPKLKDYLQSGKYPKIKTETPYVPPIRPSPLGSESNVTTTANFYPDSYSNAYGASSTDYQQYYQQPQDTFQPQQQQQQLPPAVVTTSTGYVNPMYQNPSFYNYDQQYQPQASPAPSTASSEQSWQSQMNQQFNNMRVQNTLPSSSDHSNFSNQYYNNAPPPAYQEQAPPPQYSQYPHVSQEPQYPPPPYQESSYAAHPGYTYNHQTGTYDYGSGYQYSNLGYNAAMSTDLGSNTMYTDSTSSAVNGQTFANQYATTCQTPSVAPTYDSRQQYLIPATNNLAYEPAQQQPQLESHSQPQYQMQDQQNVINQNQNNNYYNAQYGYQTASPTPYAMVNSNSYGSNLGSNTNTTNSDNTGMNMSSTFYEVNNMPQFNYVAQQPVVQDPVPSNNYQPVVQPQVIPEPTPAPQPKPEMPKKSSNIDLLSGIDFVSSPVSIETPTLQPLPISKPEDDIRSEILMPTKALSTSPSLQSLPQPAPTIPSPTSYVDRKLSIDNLSVCSDISSIDQNFDWESASTKAEDHSILNKQSENILLKYNKDPFEDQKILKWFHKEVERLEKFIDTLNVKTLNGSTPLDSKWKELQDMLFKDESKRQVSVAKLFPEKNRSIDSIPYDHARVSLPTNTDNYINAVFVKDIGSCCPPLILTQTPLPNTVNDYWNMIWSQKSIVAICLHTPNEILDTFWPQNLNEELSYGDVSVTLLKQFDLTHCIERTLKVTMLGSDFILNLSLLQIKSWPKNSAEFVLGIAQNIISTYKQQIQGERHLKSITMNCLNGADRSALVTLAIATILATQTKRPALINVVDFWYRICCQRKGALRDTNSIQFSYQIVLNNGHSILNKRGIMTSYQMKNVQTTAIAVKEEVDNDPFKDLDPLWKLK